MGAVFGRLLGSTFAKKGAASSASKAAANKGLFKELPGNGVVNRQTTSKSTPQAREARANRKWEQKQAKQEKINTKQQNASNTGTPSAGQTTLPNGQPLPGGVKTDGKGGYINAENRPVNAQGRLIDKNGNRINADGSQLTRKQKIGEHFGNNANMYMLGGTTALMGVPMLMSGSGSSITGSGASAPAASTGSASSSSYGGGGSYGIPGSLYA